MDDFNPNWNQINITTCKWTKWIMLIYILNLCSIRVQPSFRGGFNPRLEVGYLIHIQSMFNPRPEVVT